MGLADTPFASVYRTGIELAV